MATITQLSSGDDRSENLNPIEFDKVLYIGRGLESDLVLSDSRVSRKHAKIIKEGSQYVIYDLKSGNGTLVNDVQILQKPLKNSDIITVGTVKLEFSDHVDTTDLDSWILNKFGTFLHRFKKQEKSMLAFLSSIMFVRNGLKLLETIIDSDDQPEEDPARIREELQKFILELTKIFDIAEKLNHKQRSQSIVLEVANLVTPVLDEERLLRISLDIMIKVLRAERGYIIVQEDGNLVSRIARKARADIDDMELDSISWSVVRDAAESGRTILIVDTSQGEETDSRRSIVAHNIKSIICTPFSGKEELLGVVYLDRRKGVASFSESDKQMIRTIANQMAITIENTKFYTDYLENQAIRHELEVARSIQHNLLPQVLPNTKRLRASANLVFAKEVGGDYYDLFQTSNGQYAAVMADVCGKGIPAALVAASVRAYIRSLTIQIHSPAEILKTLNNLLCNELTPGYFITMVLLMFDPESSTLTYSMAGHEQPLLIDRQQKKITQLTCSALPLGFYENVDYQEETVDVHPGDSCLVYTDGITDAQNMENDRYGHERLLETVENNFDIDAEKMVQIIFFETSLFSMGREDADDSTLMVLDFQ